MTTPHSRPHAALASSILALLVLAGCSSKPQEAEPTRMGATLSGSSEIPAVSSPATGQVEATWAPASQTLSWKITHSGLSGEPTGGHFHGPAPQNETGPVALPLTGSLASPIEGTARLNAEQAAELAAGRWYVNLHTAANPGGEIRGQLMVNP